MKYIREWTPLLRRIKAPRCPQIREHYLSQVSPESQPSASFNNPPLSLLLILFFYIFPTANHFFPTHCTIIKQMTFFRTQPEHRSESKVETDTINRTAKPVKDSLRFFLCKIKNCKLIQNGYISEG